PCEYLKQEKWRWRLATNSNLLWAQVVKAIHGEEAGLDQNRCKSNGVWSKIVGSINQLHSSGIVPKHTLHYKLGSGTKVRFWKDDWSGGTPFAHRYNRLFRLDPEPDCMVIDRFVNGEWNLKWIRPIISGQNLDSLACLMTELEQVANFDGQDELRWSIRCDGTFTVKDTRHHIDDTILPALDVRTIWCKCIPRKVNIFLWKLRLDRLPLRLNLSKRGLDIQSIMCPLCSNGVESNDHLFYTCEVASSIRRLIEVWCNLHFTNLISSSDWTTWIDNLRLSKDKKTCIQEIEDIRG
ncbi:RNA-directed DNA polymerase, eukaryota, reverse transcriptase zinc-binding domain protein, partial [Tanacetum coccineum]